MDTGSFDATKLRARGLGALLSWGAILAGGSGLIAWGSTQQRIEVVERQTHQIATEQRQIDRAVSAHDTQIAVLRAQLDTIIRQLNAIDEKLERQERKQR